MGTTSMIEPDVIVIGAGPAGANAALTASELGAKVVLLDEGRAAGGQVWRAPPAAFSFSADYNDPDYSAGEALRARLKASAVEHIAQARVWNLREGFVVDAALPDRSITLQARSLVLAPGTSERLMPFQGSTLPGVVGLAAATALIKGQKMLPGRRVLVAGAGPLLAAVAMSVIKAGGEVAAVVDMNGMADWLREMPTMTSRPDLLTRGMAWMAELRLRGVPYLWRHAVVRASGTNAVQQVSVAPIDRDGRVVPGARERSFEVDSVAVGHGLSPATEMPRLLGVAQVFDREIASWIPDCDMLGRTKVDGLLMAGDACGVSGAAAAETAGRIAGVLAAERVGSIDAARRADMVKALEPAYLRSRRFGRAMARLMRPKSGLVDLIAPQTVVCRCEDISRQTLDDVLAEGARSIGQIKAWTRCGMGPCQGRMCSDAVVAIVEAAGIPRESFGQMVARPPLRPVPIGSITGEFDYEEIALPQSLPSS